MNRMQKWLAAVSGRQDLLIVGFILAVAALMIVPLPTWLMDIMIATNITIGMLFLLLAVYLKSPLEFSTLPAAILLATLVRIAITIATSRLILLQADAGQIISSFGSFVIAGNVVVGLVIFAIIAIAQFVVVTKGAERVAEVAARFALDALPGKQMSIDSDLRSGDIDRHEAKRRRVTLERESQYYGAMDGAMKFVKGDAIVSMIVIFVNLIGGLLVGMVGRGMTAGQAFDTFALLTVGDGLSSQIPALLVAIAGGIVVTRVTTEGSGNLGSDLARELVSSAQSLAIVAAALCGLSLVPGFPSATFLAMGAVAGAGALSIFMMDRRRNREREEDQKREMARKDADTGTVAPPVSVPGETLTLRVSEDVASVLDGRAFKTVLDADLASESRAIGIRLFTPGYRKDSSLPAGTAAFDVDGAPAWRGTVPAGSFFVPGAAAATGGILLPGLGAGSWQAEADGHGTSETDGMLKRVPMSDALGHVGASLSARWAARSFGLQEADQWLTSTGNQGLGSLVAQARQAVSLTRLAETCRHLLAENVSLANPRLVLESLVDLAPKIDDNAMLADQMRLALARPISARYADQSRQIPGVVIELDLEEMLRQHLREGPSGVRIVLDHASAAQLAAAARRAITRGGSPGTVFVTSFDMRRPIRQFMIGRGIEAAVLAGDEIAFDFAVRPVASLTASALSDGRDNVLPMSADGGIRVSA